MIRKEVLKPKYIDDSDNDNLLDGIDDDIETVDPATIPRPIRPVETRE